MVTRQTKPRTQRTSKPPAARRKAQFRIPKRRRGEDIHEYIARLGDSLPAEDAARLPADGSYQHDHYVYGTPKKD